VNRHDGSDGSGSGIGRKRNSSDPSDSDSVELPTPLPIPIFDLHWIVTLRASDLVKIKNRSRERNHIKLKACPNGKWLATKHHQTLRAVPLSLGPGLERYDLVKISKTPILLMTLTLTI